MASSSAAKGKDKGIPVSVSGVRYITEDLLKKAAKEEHLEQVTSINLTLSKEGGKKIRYIENLERLKKLQLLNLSCNRIEKIEKIDKLTRLRELNLSHNNICRLENLEVLVNLQVLNVTGNSIEHIPVWLGKRLKSLRTFRISKNKLQSLQELAKLKPLKDLTQLAVAENPVSQLPHCRPFLVFQLRTVETLDGQLITWEERSTAQARFAQEELEQLELLLEQEERRYHQLKDEHNRSLHELESSQHKGQEQTERMKETNRKLRDMQRELDTKNDLLKRKTSQLTQACEKHYELEQELAFYKIDHKFDTLSRPKAPTPDSGDQSLDDGLVGGESPYIGKGRFRKNEYATERHMVQHPGQAQYANVSGGSAGGGGGDGSHIEREIRERMHGNLDRELAEKHGAIQRAQERLQLMQRELASTESSLKHATEELHKLAEAQPNMHLTEDDKQQLRSNLAQKINKIQLLRGQADQVEGAIGATQQDMQLQQRDLGQLKGRLQRMGSQDSLYHSMKREVADREHQLDSSNQQYHVLQRQMRDMLTTIARETNDVKKLEQGLREGQAQQNDDIKDELEGIIGGLQTYLTDVQGKAETQRLECDGLIQEREALVQRVQDLEEDHAKMEKQTGELSLLRQNLEELEESLQDERDANRSLHQQLDETRQREAEEGEISARLHQSEDEIRKLRQTIADKERKLRADRDGYEKQLDREKQRVGYLRDKEREAADKEDEIRNLHKQLTALQKTNTGLQDDLYGLQQRLQQQEKRNVDPDILRQRLEEVTKALRTGRGMPDSRGRGKVKGSEEEEDEVGQAIGELHERVQHELNKSSREAERASRAKEMADKEVDALRDELVEVQHKERQRAERAIQTMLDEEQQGAKRLREQIEQLKEELERERALARERPIPGHLLQPSVPPTQSSETETATSSSASTSDTASSSEVSSTVHSSQWSKKRRDLYESMTQEEQELFDELQGEIEELRNLLSMRDRSKEAAKKAAEVQTMAERLRDMVDDRHRSQKSQSVGRSSAVSSTAYGSKKSHSDPRLQEAAQELARAQREVETLQAQLQNKDKLLRDKIVRTDRSQGTIVAQQDEIDDLHDVLGKQRQEIQRLGGALDVLTGRAPDQYQGYDDEVQQLRRGATDLRNRVHNLSDPVRQQGAPRDLPFGAYTDERGRPFQEAPGHSSRHADQSATRGRPLPTFYGQDGHPATDQGYQQRPGPGVGAPGMGPQGMGPQGMGPQGLGVQGMAAQGMGPQGMGPQGMAAQGMGVQNMGVPGMQGGMVPPGGPQPQPHPQPHPGMAVGTGMSASVGFGMGGAPAGSMYPPGPPAMGPQGLGMQAYPSSAPAVSTVGGHPMGGAASVAPPSVSGAPTVMMDPATMLQLQGGAIQHTPSGHTIMTSTPTVLQRTPGVGGTTPIAGSGPFMPMPMPVTPIRASQPVMMSTPTGPEVGAVRGILKKGGRTDSEDDLVCNVPEHHDLEDYIDQLQTKIKALKKRARGRGDSSSMIGDSRQVIFQDDVDRRTVRRLQAELLERRGELEGLDLAIERQKSQLKQMRQAEKAMLAERNSVKQELDSLRNSGRPDRNRRRAFLDGSGDFTVHDSDDEYEFQPRQHPSRRTYLQDEVACLEKTLARRRAELREADRLLQGCEADLVDARREAKQTVSRYQGAQQGLVGTVRDTEEIERRAREAGRHLVETEEQLLVLKEEVQELLATKQEQEQMLSDIQEVIKCKDVEFQGIEKKVKEASQFLHKTQADLTGTHAQQQERLSLLKQSDQVVGDRRTELQKLQKQVDSEKDELEEMSREVGRSKTELQLLQDTLRKRHSQLETLDSEVQGEISRKRRDIKSVEDELGDLRSEKRKLEQNVKNRQIELQQLRSSIEREDEGLKKVAADARQHQAALSHADEQTKAQRAELEGLHTQCRHTVEELEKLRSHQRQEEHQLNRVKSESSRCAADAEELKQQTSEEREVLDRLVSQRHSLEGALTQLTKEKASLEQNQKLLQRKVSELKKVQGQLEDGITSDESKLTQLDSHLRQIELAVDGSKHEKSSLDRDLSGLRDSISSGRSDLDDIHSSLREAESQVNELQQLLSSAVKELNQVKTEVCEKQAELRQSSAKLGQNQAKLEHVTQSVAQLEREAERRQHTEVKFAGLEEKVRNLAQEMVKRTEEKEQLVKALDRSCDELHKLRIQAATDREEVKMQKSLLETEIGALRQESNDRLKELHHVRQKYTNEICDLESIAQAHCSRANRLSDELNYVRSEYMEAKRQLQCQQEIAEREKKLEDTLRELKSDIRSEVTGGLMDLESSRVDTETDLDQLHDQKDTLAHQLHSLKNTLHLIREDNNSSINNSTVQESFLEQQQFLKQQLWQKMSRHSEAMQTQKQLSDDSLLHLQRKLSALEHIVSEGNDPSARLTPTGDLMNPPMTPVKDTEPSSQDQQDSGSSSTDTGSKPKRAYSPHRHSNRKPRQSPSSKPGTSVGS